jgi:SAM-dependent methyltransferase
MNISKTIEQGHYARKQLFSKDKIIAWSHRRRFEIGLELIGAIRPRRLLDYGAGDGTFLALVNEQPWRPDMAVGAELFQTDVNDCNARLGQPGRLNFAVISELGSPAHRGAYDAVVCMEVLEHITDLDKIIAELDAPLAPGGHILISVPVEIGPPLVFKQTMRRIAGWRNLGHYKYNSRYSASEIQKSLFAGDEQHITRPVYSYENGGTYHDHKGFNWRFLKSKLDKTFAIEQVITSPARTLGPAFASQVWMIGKKKS